MLEYHKVGQKTKKSTKSTKSTKSIKSTKSALIAVKLNIQEFLKSLISSPNLKIRNSK